jgi:hypothetical protein
MNLVAGHRSSMITSPGLTFECMYWLRSGDDRVEPGKVLPTWLPVSPHSNTGCRRQRLVGGPAFVDELRSDLAQTTKKTNAIAVSTSNDEKGSPPVCGWADAERGQPGRMWERGSDPGGSRVTFIGHAANAP